MLTHPRGRDDQAHTKLLQFSGFPELLHHLRKEIIDMSRLNPVQERAYNEVVKNFSFTTDSTKIDVTQSASYVHSSLFLHDYVTGVVASAASALEHLGQVRGLP